MRLLGLLIQHFCLTIGEKICLRQIMVCVCVWVWESVYTYAIHKYRRTVYDHIEHDRDFHLIVITE